MGVPLKYANVPAGVGRGRGRERQTDRENALPFPYHNSLKEEKRGGRLLWHAVVCSFSPQQQCFTLDSPAGTGCLLSVWVGLMAKGPLAGSFKIFIFSCTQWEKDSAEKCGLSKGSDNCGRILIHLHCHCLLRAYCMDFT